MSTRSLGNRREDDVCLSLHTFGYLTIVARASGAKSLDRPEGALNGDIVAIMAGDSGLPHLLVEVGGVSKRLHTAFEAMRANALPFNFSLMVVRFVQRKRLWYLDEDSRFESLEEALDALRNS